MADQGWPRELLHLISSFLTDRRARVRLESATTDAHPVNCGTPQGSPLSPILFALYLTELFLQDTKRRYGYADDMELYRVSLSLAENVGRLVEDIRGIRQWGDKNKVAFAPDKLEIVHITRQ